MTSRWTVCAVFALFAALPGFSSRAVAAPEIVVVSCPAGVRCHERLEVTFRLRADFQNPFDPREIQVDGHCTGPDGRTVVMPAFLYQESRRRIASDGREVTEPAGEPVWKLRFGPTAKGAWQIAIKARDRSGETASPPQRVEVAPSTGRGFIRLPSGGEYFQYDDGTPFFPIGQNIAWAGKRGTYDFDDWIPRSGEAGMNLARIWLQWNTILSIEHKGSGAGRYDLGNAWRMDYVMDLARKHGVRVLFTIDSPEPYQKEHYWLGKLTSKPWDNCPHNAANGGPLREPAEFYTSPEARRLIRQRLRYVVARWGWDPNVFCWELWNELNCFPGWEKLLPHVVSWHVEMADYLRAIDPNRHLITTSFGNDEGHPDVWNVRQIEFVQSHCYNLTDEAGHVPAVIQKMKQLHGRPHLVGEFGPSMEFLSKLPTVDPQGVQLHNTLWASALGGGAGTALTWCWDFYVHKANLYGVFTPLARYCADVPWTTAGFRPLEARLAWTVEPPPAPPRDLVLACQGFSPLREKVVFDPRNPPEQLGRISLQGSNHRQQQVPLLLEVNRTRAGPMIFRVGRVWVRGILEVKLDGKPVVRVDLPTGPEGQGPWPNSIFDKRWNIYGADYNREITIEIPAGVHTVELYNAGKDSIAIDRVALPRYVIDNRPRVRCLGRVGRDLALVWFQHRDHTLASLAEKAQVEPITGVEAVLPEIRAGRCQIEWFDTWKGNPIHSEGAVAGSAGLRLAIPPLKTDIACKIRW